MNWFRDLKDRTLISIAAGMLACILAFGNMDTEKRSSFYPAQEWAVLGWWGSIYPGFCFSEKPEEMRKEEEKTGQIARPKLSFWLAQALDW